MIITLSIFLPLPSDEKIRNLSLHLLPGTTVGQVMDRYHIPDDKVWLYVVNHRQIRQRGDALSDGDHLMVFPPLEGG